MESTLQVVIRAQKRADSSWHTFHHEVEDPLDLENEIAREVNYWSNSGYREIEASVRVVSVVLDWKLYVSQGKPTAQAREAIEHVRAEKERELREAMEALEARIAAKKAKEVNG